MEDKNDFEYQYFAPTSEERREIESIRSGYLPKEPTVDKLQRLRKLDSKAKNIPTTFSMIIGIIGALVFGLGLTMSIEWNIIAWGIIVGIVGAVVMTATPFIHKLIAKTLKNKYSKEILKLSEELLNDENK